MIHATMTDRERINTAIAIITSGNCQQKIWIDGKETVNTPCTSCPLFKFTSISGRIMPFCTGRNDKLDRMHDVIILLLQYISKTKLGILLLAKAVGEDRAKEMLVEALI